MAAIESTPSVVSQHDLTKAATSPKDGQARTLATSLRRAGTLLVLAGCVALLGIISAEALYPAPYSTGASMISDLGATEPPDSIIHQPSATIFNLSMMAVGLLAAASALLVHRGLRRPSLSIPLGVLGLAALGVGIFPGNTGTQHALCALATFVSGGVAAVASARVVHGPFRCLSLALGAIALLTIGSYIVLGEASPMARLGDGGLERWIVYPIVLWITAFGGYLLGAVGETRGAALPPSR